MPQFTISDVGRDVFNLILRPFLQSPKGWQQIRSVNKDWRSFADENFPFAKHRTMQKAIQRNAAATVALLLRFPQFDPTDGNYFSFREAAHHGATNVISVFKKDPRITAYAVDIALVEAAAAGQAQATEMLLTGDHDRFDERTIERALGAAISNKYYSTAKLLALHPKSNPCQGSGWVINFAIRMPDIPFLTFLVKSGRKIQFTQQQQASLKAHRIKK
eukprot:TRINITY_DN8781_c0_g1_i1.p1 TRINITY_DN8781_c0_g1~~TRINITY_DN8781_c0_g1_i1.p1  ORF type:complete len:218 (+),score=35.06 TRINITY_DN8781_c0_g1_i1:102-755(+)